MSTPLAERIRPKSFDDYISQQHLVGKNGVLTGLISQGIMPSLILWGPPGIGKTTLANIIAKESKRPFYTLSAINSGVKEVREVINSAKKQSGLFTAKKIQYSLLTKFIDLVNLNKIHSLELLKRDGLL